MGEDEKQQLYTIIPRHDTSTNWTIKDPILAAGEYGIEDDTHKIKRGDGKKRWTELLYETFGMESFITSELFREYIEKVIDEEAQAYETKTFITVATMGDLPESPKKDTVYYIEEIEELRIFDFVIKEWIEPLKAVITTDVPLDKAERNKFYVINGVAKFTTDNINWQYLVPGSGNSEVDEYAENTKYYTGKLLYLDNYLVKVLGDFTSANEGTAIASLKEDITNGKLAVIVSTENEDNRLTVVESDITTIKTQITDLDNDKVDKEAGKGLSTEDYTTAEKIKLAGLTNYDDTSVKARITALETDNTTNKTNIQNNATDINNRVTKSDAEKFIKDVTFNTTTQKFTFTMYDNTTKDIEIMVAGVIKSGSYDTVKEAIILTLVDNSVIEIPVGSLIDIYTGDDTATISVTVDSSNKITATVKAGSITETLLSSDVQTKLNKTYDLTPYAKISYVDDELAKKVDKVTGKGLSTEDYTTTEKTKLAGLSNYDDTALSGRVTSLETDNTTNKSDINTLKTNVADKVDKVIGKGLSTEDYTTAEKTKLAGLDNYTLPNASSTTLGGIKVGNNLSIDSDGVLSATGGSTVTVDSSLSTTSENPVQNKVVTGAINNKVDIVAGKGLSTNDFTDSHKNKLDNLFNYDDTQIKSDLNDKVDKVLGKQLSTEDYTTAEKTKLAGLENYDDTQIKSDLGDKVDKETGKGLSTNDYTDAEKTKLAGLNNYTLPTASDTVLGGIKVGDNLSIDNEGV